LQPATANYFGLMPVNGNGIESMQTNAYAVSSSEGAIYAGDICVFTSRNTVRAISTGSAAGGASVIGVAAQYFAANVGSTTVTNLNKCLIYDAPDQLFTACDSSSGVVGSSGIGLSYFILATGVTGSTGPNTTLNRSVMAISGAVQASSAGNVKIVALHPVENNVYGTAATGAASVRKWVVALRSHVFQAAAGTEVLTS